MPGCMIWNDMQLCIWIINTEHQGSQCQKRRLSWPWSQGSTMGLRLLSAFWNSYWTSCSQCRMPLHSSFSGPRPASTVQLTLVSSSGTDFIPSGGAGVSLPPWLYSTRLSGDNCNTSQTSMHVDDCALLVHQRSSLHVPPCYRWRPCLPGGCCVCLEQSAGVSTNIAITDSNTIIIIIH